LIAFTSTGHVLFHVIQTRVQLLIVQLFIVQLFLVKPKLLNPKDGRRYKYKFYLLFRI